MSLLALGKNTSVQDSTWHMLTVNSLTAAKDAVGDKFDQSSHDGKAEAHKQFAKN